MKYRCEGCGEFLDEKDVKDWGGPLCHDTPIRGFISGEIYIMLCGPVHDLEIERSEQAQGEDGGA